MVKKWSEKVKKRRISCFGHLSRLPENCSAKQALYEALRPAKRPKGRQQTTWLEIVKKQLKEKGFDTIYEAIDLARNNRKTWQNIVKQL